MQPERKIECREITLQVIRTNMAAETVMLKEAVQGQGVNGRFKRKINCSVNKVLVTFFCLLYLNLPVYMAFD